MRRNRRNARLLSGGVLVLLLGTACGTGSVTVDSEPASSTESPALTPPPTPPVLTHDAKEAKEREKQNPKSHIACVNPDGTLLGMLIVSGEGTRADFTAAERKSTCDAMTAKAGPDGKLKRGGE